MNYNRSIYSAITDVITRELDIIDDSLLIIEIEKSISSNEIDFSNNHNLDRKKLQTIFRTWLSKKYGKGVYEANITLLEYNDHYDRYDCNITIQMSETHRKFLWGSISYIDHKMESWFE